MRTGALTPILGYGRFMDAPRTLAIVDNPEKHRFEADLGDGASPSSNTILSKGGSSSPTLRFLSRTAGEG
jgi:hypothetical protein